MGFRDVATAILVITLWAANLVVQKVAVEYISVYLLNFLRLAIIAPLIIFYLRKPIPFSKYFICGLFWNVLNFVLIGFGLKAGIGAGVSSFLILTNSLFGIIFCFLILREKPTLPEVIGIGVAFVGVLLLSSNTISQSMPLLGFVFLIGASISWGIGFTLLKKLKIGGAMSDNIWLSAISAIPLFLFCLFIDGSENTFQGILNLSPVPFACIVFASVFSTVIAGYLWLSLGQRVRSSSMMPFLLLFPVFSCVLSWLFLKEDFTLIQVTSGLVIFVGIFISQISRIDGLKSKIRVNSFLKVRSHVKEQSPNG